MKGKQILMEMLKAEGTEYIFGNPGTMECPLEDALQDYPEIQYIVALQEATALGMGDGYARATQRPAVVSIHVSVGIANAISLLYDAYRGGTPLVVLAGQVDTHLLLHEALLWSDMAEMTKHYTKWSAEVIHTSELAAVLRRAFKVAKSPPTGPVFLSLPWNMMDEEVEAEIVPSSPGDYRIRPDLHALGKAVELLSSSDSPMMLVGDRIAQSGGVDEAVSLAETLGVPVYSLDFSEVNFPTSHPLYQGGLGVASPTRRTRNLLAEADVILAIGCDVICQHWHTPEPLLTAGDRVIHLDSSQWEIEKRFPVAVGLWADPKTGMKELAEALDASLSRTQREKARERTASMTESKAARREAFRRRAEAARERVPIAPEVLTAELAKALPPNAIIADESITVRSALAAAIPRDRPGDYFGARGGGLGWGMPGPLGLKLAFPKRPVVAVVGDGSSMYTIQALWTAARYNIPVTYVICNNRSYKIVKEGMARYLAGTERESEFVGLSFYEKPIDVARIAESFDLVGIKVERPEELQPALEKALGAGRTAVVDVHIEERLEIKAIQEEWLAWQKG
jgi:benzoylformate decarboxylase